MITVKKGMKQNMNILLDAMGGDNAPDANIKGAIKAINQIKAEVTLIGKEEVIKSDFKSFPIGDKKVAIGQVFTLDVDRIFDELDSYINTLEEINAREGYSFIIICLTDIIKNGSYIIYTKEAEKVLENIYGEIKQGYYVDGLVSRKKQILPAVLENID